MTLEGQFEGRLALQQRVLPSYRVAFFDLLAGRSTEGLSLYAGKTPAKRIDSDRGELEQG